jgi:acetylornithine deacetylase/succinyl-diaminopimelate desuccinylase-like protein
VPYSDLRIAANRRKESVLATLRELIRHPSIALVDRRGVEACAVEVEQKLGTLGFRVSRFCEKGSPLILAEKDVGARRTLMFYHHYDVQPPGKLDLWKSSPWKLEIREDRIYGRGASDDKGPLAASLESVEMLEETLGKLPVNVKFVVDGEEEAGPVNLPRFISKNPGFMKADGCIWETASAMPNSPSDVVCGMKGEVYFELRAGGAPRFPLTDVHSGEAGVAPSAAWRLTWALNSLKDEKERILIDGFLKEIRKPDEDDVAAIRDHESELGRNLKKMYGVENLVLGRDGFELASTLYLDPTISICGLTSGHQGPEDMTIVPSSAHAKIDIRIVPDLTVEKTERLLRAHLEKRGFDDIQVISKGGYDPGKTFIGHPFVRLMRKASSDVVNPGKASIIPMASASGPVSYFTPHVPICMTFSYDEAVGTNSHAPNENAPIESIECEIAFTALVAQRLAEMK